MSLFQSIKERQERVNELAYREEHGVKNRKQNGVESAQLQKSLGKEVLVVFAVIPVKAGIQYFRNFLDSRLRGSDHLCY